MDPIGIEGAIMLRSVITLMALSLVLAACGDDAETDALVTAAVATTLPAAATTILASGDFTEVTFDESGCKVSGPTKVSAGDHYIVVKNLTELRLDLYVSMLIDGHTYQDLIDLQSEPGVYYPKESWVIPLYQAPGGRVLADNGREYQLSLEKSEHAHAIYLWTPANGGLWFCSPPISLEVVEVTS